MRLKVLPAIFSRAEESVAFDQPAVVVGLAEREQRLTEFLDGLEGPHPQQVLLQGADEPLGAAIALRGADKGRRTLDAEEGQFSLKVTRQVLRAVIVAHRQAAGPVPGRPPPKWRRTPLANRLQ